MQDAVPLASVVAVQVSVPLRERLTDAPARELPLVVSVNVAESVAASLKSDVAAPL